MATASASRDFPNTTDVLRIDDTTNYNFVNVPFSVCGWVYFDSTQNSRLVSNRSDPSFNGWSVGIGNSSKMLFTKGAVIDMEAPTFVFSTGAWAFWAFLWDDDNDTIYYYLNGATETRTNSDSFTSSATNLYIGQFGDSDLKQIDGRLSNVMIWDRFVTPTEMDEVMWNPNAFPDNKVSYWPLTGLDSNEVDLGTLKNNPATTGSTTVFNDGPPIHLLGGQ